MNASRQQGSALIVALFLVIVVGALSVFALRIGGTQQHTAALQILGYQTEAAAQSGMEVWAHRIANATPAPACPLGLPTAIQIGNYPSTGLNSDYTVRLESCTRIVSGAEFVYDLTVSAQRGTFGQTDFVRREVSRRMSNIGTGSYR